MTSLSAINAAAADPDLQRRLIAAAAMIGVPDHPEAFVMMHKERLAAAPVGDGDATVASVYEYACAQYTPPPRPGENPAAVTDAHLIAAVQAVAHTQDT